MTIVDAVIHFSQVNVLIEGAIVGVGSSSQITHCGSLKRIGRRGQRDQNRVTGIISLAVVIEEKERVVLDNGPANVSAKLVEMVAGLQRSRPAGGKSRG